MTQANSSYKRPRMKRSEFDALQMNYEAAREIEGEWAEALDEIARDLPGYERPKHDPYCASCTISGAVRALAAHVLGPDHRLARTMEDLLAEGQARVEALRATARPTSATVSFVGGTDERQRL